MKLYLSCFHHGSAPVKRIGKIQRQRQYLRLNTDTGSMPFQLWLEQFFWVMFKLCSTVFRRYFNWSASNFTAGFESYPYLLFLCLQWNQLISAQYSGGSNRVAFHWLDSGLFGCYKCIPDALLLPRIEACLNSLPCSEISYLQIKTTLHTFASQQLSVAGSNS